MSYPQTILLTDDEAHIRKYLGLILRKFDRPTICEAGNGAEAVELYRRSRPDLVFLDVHMPVLDGIQALGQIKAIDPDAIVVMLTSLANQQTVDDCLRLGATGYIRKDTPRDALTATFEQIIDECYGSEVPA